MNESESEIGKEKANEKEVSTFWLTVQFALPFGAMTLLGLSLTISRYQCWLANKWLGEDVGDSLIVSGHCDVQPFSELQLWMPAWCFILTGVVTLPWVWRNVRSRGALRWLTPLAAIPWLNLLIAAYLLMARSGKTQEITSSTWFARATERMGVAVMMAVLGYLQFPLWDYYSWLAARS